MRILLVGVVVMAAAGCHGIQPSAPSPISQPSRSSVPVKLSLTMNPPELPIGGGSAIVRVEALGADGMGVVTSVELTASDGELAGARVTTDSTGHGTASWQGTKTVTITGTAGEVASSATLRVSEPAVFPPPSPPRPPAPQPTPTPLPPQPPTPPQLSASMSAYPDRVAVGYVVYLTAAAQNLAAGDSIIAYQWSWDGDDVIEETSIDATRPHVYSTDGIKAPRVQILTLRGGSATGTGRVIVYRP